MTMAERIKEKLARSLTPRRLVVRDDSERHRGHGGYREGGETHFSVEIVSGTFTGLSRVQRQRLVYQALDAELKGGVHALELKTLTPDEDKT